MGTGRLFRRSSSIATATTATAAAVLLVAAPALAATWSSVPSGAVGTQSTLAAADLLSGSDGWAVGATPTTGGVIERWNGQRLAVVTSPNILDGQINAFAGLTAVDALSSSTAFAVGATSFYGTDGLSHSNAVAERWNGTAWSRLTVPNNPSINSFSAVKAFSATDVWAIGRAGDSFSGATLAMHWNGTGWTTAATPSPGTRDNILTRVSGSGPNDLWAVGYYRDLPYGNRAVHSLALHWNGSSWSRVATPDVGPIQTFLKDVVALSPTNAWAVGYASGGINGTTAVVLHWNGTAWSVSAAPALGALNSVAAVSATDLWATGSDSTTGMPALANWRGSSWTTSAAPLAGSPAFASISGLAASGTSLLGVGYTSVPSTGASAPLAIATGNG
jgi:hypothetical protein